MGESAPQSAGDPSVVLQRAALLLVADARLPADRRTAEGAQPADVDVDGGLGHVRHRPVAAGGGGAAPLCPRQRAAARAGDVLRGLAARGGCTLRTCGGTRVCGAHFHERVPARPVSRLARGAVEEADHRETRRGRREHVVFVRYAPEHKIVASDMVYNAPDIDASPIVWARYIGPSQDRELIDYYPRRKSWIHDVDASPMALRPYAVP